MSTKDTMKAVQTVLDTFGPVMAAMPAALEALGQQDKAERRLKQLQDDANKLVDQYNAQVALWEKSEAEHKARLAAREMESFTAVEKAKAELKDIQQKQRQATKAITDKEKALLTAQSVIESELAKVRAECDAQITAARKLAQEQIATIEAEVEAVEKRHAAAVKKLEELKAKL